MMKVNEWSVVVRSGGWPIWTDVVFDDGRSEPARILSLSVDQIFDLEYAVKRASDHLRREIEQDHERQLRRIRVER